MIQRKESPYWSLMSIYNRTYMRHDYRSESGPWALKYLLITLIAVFVVQNIATQWFGSTLLEYLFSLQFSTLSNGFIHTLLTYGFLHSTQDALPWHLVFNGLMLYWFGKEVEQRIGSRHFIELFLFAVIAGGVIWVTVNFLLQNGGGVVGASSAVFGIIYLFCRYRWDTELMLLFLPFRFSGKQLFAVLIGFQVFFFLFAELPGATSNSTAYSAHLGGVLGAFLYERWFLEQGRKPVLSNLFTSRNKPTVVPPKWEKRATPARQKVNLSSNRSASEMKAEVDRILDKINARGFGSLSDEEKALLDNAKDVLRG